MSKCLYGSYRVIEPKNVLPQSADKINNSMNLYPQELRIDVDTLNIDSASFTQLKKASNNDPETMKQMILDIVNDKGKMQNPVTKSGGMLIGSVNTVGKDFPNQALKKGTKIATLVSLSLTPLKIDEILSINMTNDQVKIKGQAILFPSGIYAEIPSDLNEHLVLAALDVAGAPAQVDHLVKENDTVLVIGAAGKSGLLCAYQAKQRAGINGKVIGFVNEEAQVDLLESLGFCDEVILGDATNALSVYEAIKTETNDNLCDVVINVVNVENTEMASILSTKDRGTVYFFSMATSFTKAALGAEGVGKDVNMLVGNGYTKNHAETTLKIMRENKALHDLFMKLYA